MEKLLNEASKRMHEIKARQTPVTDMDEFIAWSIYYDALCLAARLRP